MPGLKPMPISEANATASRTSNSEIRGFFAALRMTVQRGWAPIRMTTQKTGRRNGASGWGDARATARPSTAVLAGANTFAQDDRFLGRWDEDEYWGSSCPSQQAGRGPRSLRSE